MNIGLYNLEPRYLNLALEKINIYHQQLGDTVSRQYQPLEHGLYDRVYCSSMFTWTHKSYITDDMICGGTGFNLTAVLPPEIESIIPRINVGFTTRGCIRACPFCVVPEKEGMIRRVADIGDIWDGTSTDIVLLDNNILALRDWFLTVCRDLRESNLVVDFNQGLDIRLVDDGIAYQISNLKHKKQIRFAWDLMQDESRVLNGLNLMLQYVQPYKIMVYVLAGYNTTEEEDLHRIRTLSSRGVDPFVMSYNKNPRCRHLARWVNHKAIFKSVPWKDYRKIGAR